MQKEDDNKIIQQISLAKDRLHKKLQTHDINSLGVSEYNQRYFEEKLKNISGTLNIYGNLLKLCISENPLPIQKIVFVDYGGGSGLLSLLAKELGIGKVIYIDIYDSSCNDVGIVSNALGLPLDHIICGDVDELISFVQQNSITINSIASYDVLEHIYDIEDHFNRLSEISENYFRIVYASTANIEKPNVVRNLKKKQIEAEYNDKEMTWRHKGRDTLRSYYNIRKDIISSYSPELDSEEVEQITKITRGLIESDIKKCVDEHLHNGHIKYNNNHPTNTCDPYTGNWCEHLMEIKWLEEILKDSGYSVKIMGGNYNNSQASLPKKTISSLLNYLIHLLGRHSLFMAPYFIVLAEHNIKERHPKISS